MSVRRRLVWAAGNRRMLAAVALVGMVGAAVELGWGRTTDWRSASGDDLAPFLRSPIGWGASTLP